MRKQMLRYLCVAGIGACLTATPALADPLTITSGQLFGNFITGGFTLNGSDFSLNGNIENGLVMSAATCGPCSSSNPITPLRFSGLANGRSSQASSEFNGITYPTMVLGYDLEFFGPTFSSSDLSPSRLALSGGFGMTGVIQGWASAADFQGSKPPVFVTEVRGGGTATATFTGPIHDPQHGDLFDSERLTFSFQSPAATPEPASLLLLATGVAPLILRRRRRL